jgi:hypothetical protein
MVDFRDGFDDEIASARRWAASISGTTGLIIGFVLGAIIF